MSDQQRFGGPVPDPPEVDTITGTRSSSSGGRYLRAIVLKVGALALFYIALLVLLEFSVSILIISGNTPPEIDDTLYFLLPALPAAYLALGTHMVREYERATVLFLGRARRNGFQILGRWPKRGILRAVRGPGVFIVLPILEEIEEIGSLQIIEEPIAAIQTLTKDTVAIDAEGIFYFARDPAAPEKSALEVENFVQSCVGAGNAAYKQLIGSSSLDEVLARKPDILEDVLSSLRELLSTWGGIAIALRLTDVRPDKETRDKLSSAARAKVDAQARLETAVAEKEIAEANAAAAKIYKDDPMAWEIREQEAFLEAVRTGKASVIYAPNGLSPSAEAVAVITSQDSDTQQGQVTE